MFKFFHKSKQVTVPKETPYHKIFPIIAITLFFSHWFAEYSYGSRFHDIYNLFTGRIIHDNGLFSFKTLVNILTLIGLAIIITPVKDKAPIKWGMLISISFLLFFFKNITAFPDIANHSMMMFFLFFGYLIIAFNWLMRGKITKVFTNTDYLPLMRASLIIMYFFGTFHKINTDFLLEDGCWRAFYNTIPLLPDFMKQPSIALILGGYGTLVLEFFALTLLFFPKTKYYGMLLGMLFHFIIGIVTDTGTIAHFSAFAIALHMSFLSTNSIDKFKESKAWKIINTNGRGSIYIRIPFVLFLIFCVILSALQSNIITFTLFSDVNNIGYKYIETMWVIYTAPVLVFVLLYGGTPEKRLDKTLVSKVLLANIVSIALFLNAITTYVGLKANADLAMFSNLRTEWGKSNHYIIKKPLQLFPYLDKENYIQLINFPFRPYNNGNNNDDNQYHNLIRENTWQHKLTVQRYTYTAMKSISKTDLDTFFIEYKNHEGKVFRVDKTTKSHYLLERPSWWARNYLHFTDFVNIVPRPCSSR